MKRVVVKVGRAVFVQDAADETLGYDRTLPYLVAPISSATFTNIEALKYSLFNLVQADRK